MAEKYPVNNAPLTCSNGSKYAYINNPKRGTTIGNQNAALLTDSKPHNVWGDFGYCSASKQGENRLCIKAFSGDWFNVSSKVFVSVFTEYLSLAVDSFVSALNYYSARTGRFGIFSVRGGVWPL